jgi:hypothetical protein
LRNGGNKIEHTEKEKEEKTADFVHPFWNG